MPLGQIKLNALSLTSCYIESFDNESVLFSEDAILDYIAIHVDG